MTVSRQDLWSRAAPLKNVLAGNMKSDSNKALIIPAKRKCVDALS